MTPFDDKPHDSMMDEVAEHPVSTGAGAVAGGVAGGLMGSAAAGAAIGGLTGPAGAVIGAVVGVVAGAVVGNKAGHAFDPHHEEAYWADHFRSRPYVDGQASYTDYGPAYRYGLDTHTRYPGRHIDEVDGELSRDWQQFKGESKLEWEKAKHATRDAWQRVSDSVERAIPGDSDRDGK